MCLSCSLLLSRERGQTCVKMNKLLPKLWKNCMYLRVNVSSKAAFKYLIENKTIYSKYRVFLSPARFDSFKNYKQYLLMVETNRCDNFVIIIAK